MWLSSVHSWKRHNTEHYLDDFSTQVFYTILYHDRKSQWTISDIVSIDLGLWPFFFLLELPPSATNKITLSAQHRIFDKVSLRLICLCLMVRLSSIKHIQSVRSTQECGSVSACFLNGKMTMVNLFDLSTY